MSWSLCLLAPLLLFISCSKAIQAQPESGSGDRIDITKLWGAYSPFFASGTYHPPPAGCTIDQVNLLQRHGARYPTSGASATILSGLQKLQNVPEYHDPRLNFLKNFTYTLGVADLVPLGAGQSFSTGELAFLRYKDLVTSTNIPFVRASSSQRVIDSATNWTSGFSAASNDVYTPVLSVILSETANDTLDDSSCPNARSSDAATDAWLAVFAPPITARLNTWAPGANLTDAETYSMLSMCPFHTVASASRSPNSLKLSPFCALFSDAEFADFEYYSDLDKYYGTGYGGYLGPVQGVGYINELLARLTHTPVHDSTSTNTTLTSNPATFPLNRTMYADFSHDDELAAIYAAMGLFRQTKALQTTTQAPSNRTWIASHLVPFSARMVVERMACGGGEQWVRVLVSDAVQPLEFCAAKDKEEGMCRLGAFVESQSYARSGGDGDWEKCFV